MNHFKNSHLFFACLIFLISCEGNKNLTETPLNSVSETSEVQEELIPLVPSITPEPYQRVLAGTPLPVLETVISPENVNNIVELARWGDGTPKKLVISPDGKLVFIASSIGFYVFSYENLEVKRFVELNSDIGDLVISPNGQLLVVSTREKILIYEISNLDLIKTLERSATNLAFSPDGKTLAMGMGDWQFCRQSGSIELWVVETWSLLQTMDGEFSCIGDLLFSSSGKYLAVSEFNVVVWEITNGEAKLKFQNSGCGVFERSLAFTKDEKKLLVETLPDSGRDNICLINVKDGDILGVLENESPSDYSCQPHIIMSPDGSFMAVNFDGKISIWQVDELKRIQDLGGGKECVSNGRWLLDNKTLITLSNQQLQIWDVPNKKLMYSEFLPQQTLPINIIDWSPDGKTIATANSDGVISLWQASNGNVFSQLENQGNITSIEFSPDSKLLAVGLESDQANIWDLKTKTIIQTLHGASGYGSTKVSFSKDGTLIALDIEDDNFQLDTADVQVWNTDTWLPSFTLTANGFFTDVSISSDNRLLAVTSSDGVSSIWNIRSREIMYELKLIQRGRLLSMDFAPNNKFLAVSRRDASVFIWNLTNGKLVSFYENPDLDYDNWKGVYFLYKYDNVEWSYDGQLIALSMPDGNIHLLNPSDGTVLKKLVGHTLWATGVTFSPDGKMLASSSFDGTVRLWGIVP